MKLTRIFIPAMASLLALAPALGHTAAETPELHAQRAAEAINARHQRPGAPRNPNVESVKARAEGRTLITETIYKLPPAGTATTAASTATSTAQLAAKLEHANLTLACAKARNDEFFMQQGFALRYRYHYTDGRAIADFTLDRARCASVP